ncbi:MAG TPA: di-heme oxidoredictase family protein [Thermoanaerobaculia bacterium]|nr:di-heme oxidoredictase family protein [Thermoanaerobaculia bacterium]
MRASAFALPSVIALAAVTSGFVAVSASGQEIGSEVSMTRRLAEGDEHRLTIPQLIQRGFDLFGAMWTVEEGGGRPLSKGTGAALSDPSSPLVFPRNFNRISAPDANACVACHNLPRSGGGGDVVANAFVLAQRFDFASFDPSDSVSTRGGLDEVGNPIGLDTISNNRASIGMFGSGYIEMLARQMTTELQAIRNGIPPGGEAALEAKGIPFGLLRRNGDGTWDTSAVEGLPSHSLVTSGAGAPPTLLVRPFHQAGAVVSLREFTNNAFNHHHGIQSSERFGDETDADGDGFVAELSRAEVTAVSIYQATLPPPGRVIPRNRAIEEAVLNGEQRFEQVGCTSCHVPALPLTNWGWYFEEPGPFNPNGNLRRGDVEPLYVNLNSGSLPGPRLRESNSVTWVPAYTDLKLHDLTDGEDDPAREPLNMHFPPGSEGFFAGNGRFLTKKLWGAANERPYFHHGLYTTLREAIHAHGGEGADSRAAFLALSEYDQGSIIEFLKTLQVLPENAPALVVDEKGRPRAWPPLN